MFAHFPRDNRIRGFDAGNVCRLDGTKVIRKFGDETAELVVSKVRIISKRRVANFRRPIRGLVRRRRVAA